MSLRIPSSNSLKDKRQVLRSLKDKIRGKFNVSVAEVGSQDVWRSAELGITGVSGDKLFMEKEMARILNLIDARNDLEITDHSLEYIQ